MRTGAAEARALGALAFLRTPGTRRSFRALCLVLAAAGGGAIGGFVAGRARRSLSDTVAPRGATGPRGAPAASSTRSAEHAEHDDARPDAPASTDDIARARRLLRALTLERLGPGMNHDLRGPINAIALNVELLRRANSDGERNATRLAAVAQETTRLRAGLELLLRQLCAPGDDARRFDAREVLADVVQWVAPQARQSRVTFDFDVAENALPAFCRVDVLREALLGLAAALVQLVPAQGRVFLHATSSTQDGADAHTIVLGASGLGTSRVEDDAAVPAARALLAREGVRLTLHAGPEIRIALPTTESASCRTPSSSTTIPTR